MTSPNGLYIPYFVGDYSRQIFLPSSKRGVCGSHEFIIESDAVNRTNNRALKISPGQTVDVVVEASRVNIESSSVPNIRCHEGGKEIWQ